MITVPMIVTKRIILNLGNIDSIFLLDESLLEPIVLKGTRWVLRRERRSNPPDLSDVGLELNARLTELGANFVIRLRNDVYKEEIANMTSNDEFVKLKLTDSRLEKFHDIELKEKYSKKDYIELRVVKTKVKVIKYDEKTNEEYEEEIDEILLTNFTKEEMSVEDLKEIYKLRWGIEVDFDTLKNRFGIENFSGSIKLTHQQDLYSQFVIFNVYCYINNLLNMKLQRRFVKKYGEEYLDYDFEYKINQANLIRNLLEDFRKIMGSVVSVLGFDVITPIQVHIFYST